MTRVRNKENGLYYVIFRVVYERSEMYTLSISSSTKGFKVVWVLR